MAQQPYYNGQAYGQQGGYAMPPPQQYGQYGGSPQYPPPNGQQQYGMPQQPQNGFKNEKFQQQPLFAPEKPKWNDLWAALLFYLNMAGFIVVAVISLRALVAAGPGQIGDSTGITLNKSTAYLFCLITAAGFVLAILYLGLVRLFTRFIFELTLLLSVLLSVGYAIYLWTQKYTSGAIIFTIFAVISVIAYPFMRKRIPFSKAILICTLKVANKYKSTYILAILGATFQAAYSVLWAFVLTASYQKWQPNTAVSSEVSGGSGQGALIVVCIFLVFHLYWTSQVFANVLLATEAGIFGAWYFSGFNLPKAPALGAFKRSMTYSFGSICFGSLIVAVLDFIRAALQVLQNQEAQQGDMIGYAFFCCAQCCLGCISGLVEYFNKYAYIEISLFGKPYVPAAKDTWNLLKQRGIDALINDCLVNNIWTFGSFLVGALCCLFAYLYIHLINPGFAQDGSSITAVILLYAFSIGLFICHTLGYACLSAGVSTLFVGIAEEPAALQDKDPALYQVIAEKYPHILTPV